MLWLTRRAALWSRTWSIGDVEGSWDLECDTAAIKLEALQIPGFLYRPPIPNAVHINRSILDHYQHLARWQRQIHRQSHPQFISSPGEQWRPLTI